MMRHLHPVCAATIPVIPATNTEWPDARGAAGLA
jgi:hypothetical protein